jgi:hypothetical protein
MDIGQTDRLTSPYWTSGILAIKGATYSYGTNYK